MSLTIVHHTVSSPSIHEPVTFAVVSDLHNGPYNEALPHLKAVDAILICGDLVNRHRKGYDNAVRFLQDAPSIAPTFYAIGNHEWKFKQRNEYWPLVQKSPVKVLDNYCMRFRGIVLGGFSSAPSPDPRFLEAMARKGGFKLLICHHPEYFSRYIAHLPIDLTLSGHAHGGQIQLLGQGLYAPGQGILPRLTHGFYHDSRLLVSRGMTNSARAPRLWNPCELILLHLTPSHTGADIHA